MTQIKNLTKLILLMFTLMNFGVKAQDVDSDNDGIPDCVEKQLTGATMATLFNINGNASNIDDHTVRLTPNTQNKSGSMWSKNKINFAQSFTIRYQAYLGNDGNGADGIATVFHNDPAGNGAIGEDGFGIGAAGIVNGIALEMDTYKNNSTTGDISANHGMIWDTDGAPTNGNDSFIPGVVSLTSAVSIGNVEDGNWHNVVVSWDATTSTLSYTVDGTNAGTYTHTAGLDDFCETYFDIPASETNKLVYYGYTASTGGNTNDQQVRINDFCADYPQFVDTDGDGVEDYLDLDSDGDGCFDALEGSGYVTQDQLKSDGSIMGSEDANGIPLIANGGQGAGSAYDANINACDEEICTEPVAGEPFSWNYPNGTPSPVTRTFTQPATNYGFVLDIYSLDNSFNLNINGTNIAASEIEFQSDSTPAPGINVRFADGDEYETDTEGDIWEMTGTAANPLIRVVINPDGTIALFGSKTSGGPLFPLELFNGNSLNTITWNNGGTNTIIATQNVVNVTSISGSGYGLNIVPCACYKPGLTDAGNTYPTKVGITALSRAGAVNADNWPMVRESGWIALEAKTKGFVPNRVAFDTAGNPVGIATTNFVEGMMVYDTTNKCMKIYTLKEGDTAMAWHCMTTQACPD